MCRANQFHSVAFDLFTTYGVSILEPRLLYAHRYIPQDLIDGFSSDQRRPNA